MVKLAAHNLAILRIVYIFVSKKSQQYMQQMYNQLTAYILQQSQQPILQQKIMNL
ncbi:hypothetical protein TTHERM_01010030 (macronuclear) [Tetrahymena thermophila SB210]|uniref:Uncharacterized protein n=1 Tax=Tetrahymena thermophila (strain SB210) TaxID=312017 RepID=Q23LP3_TETTS|nr:hypothetical protein TTHERM_01010030 [Tetrahymena thermophila SB210]EAR97467.1 hypothetical protein TTHERM_01010030 [Tetrahymena thermophila SB210]|eukprot:XP_001017712.1 hypothetical protein TTHERM_01010030 [Tetrahymena thermophila SB210]